jgi:hypothetical protein
MECAKRLKRRSACTLPRCAHKGISVDLTETPVGGRWLPAHHNNEVGVGVSASALGHKRTFCDATAMSALPPRADIHRRLFDVRFVPIADIADPSFDYIVGPQKDRRWDVDAQYFGRL